MRRLIDIVVATIALAVLSPVLIVAALAVFVSSPGNPFYAGRRVGRGGKQFRMWKFRTMIKDAAKLGCITGRNDPRVTGVGRFLRKTKLDELPQFFNLLIGDMTVVGPRPESPEMVAHYTPRQWAVLSVKPGITGRGQIRQDDESETIPESVQATEYYLHNIMARKLQEDLDYLNDRTPLTDMRIVLSTANLMLRTLTRR